MLRNDYILRLIRQLARAVARVVHRMDRGEIAESVDELDQSIEDLTGISLALLRDLPFDQLTGALRRSDGPDGVRMLAAAEALFLDARLAEARGIPPENCVRSRFKAMALYAIAIPVLGDCVDEGSRQRAWRTLEDLKEWQMPLSITPAVLEWLRSEGAFAEVENLLFEAIEESSARDLVAWGLAFYRNLLRLPDADLAAGGLPRDEVQAGLRELERS